MLGMNDLKLGTVVVWKGQPHVVVSAQHVQMGRGGAILRTKLKNLLTGNQFEETFKSGDKLDQADMTRTKASFLYKDADNANFMDSESFEQFGLPLANLGLLGDFLVDGMEVSVQQFDGKPLSIELPVKLKLTVTETAAAVKGNTAGGNVQKEATLDSGYVAKVPLFIKQGDSVIINTETGQYVERG